MQLSEARAHESAQDHDSLVVRRARHPRLTLDIDDARLPERDGCGHARRTPEAVAADVQHGEAVDLSNAGAANMDDERAFRDKAANFFFDEIEPQHPLAKRALNVRGRHALSPCDAREVCRLAR